MQLKSATAVIGLAVSASVAHADTGWSVDAGVIHTDNATLANSGGASDTVAAAGGALAWELRRSRLQATLNGAGSWLHYLDDTYADDFLAQANASATLQLLPERVAWNLTDSYGQIATDAFAPQTPNNRQNVNVFSTGPELHLRLGDQARLQLSGSYGDTHYEKTGQIDTRNWGGSAGLLREVSGNESLGLFVSQTRYAYDVPDVPPYDQQAAWVAWQVASARQSLNVDVGVNRVRGTGASETNPMLRATWQRRIRPLWTMNLQLDSEYQNTGQQFAAGNDTNVGVSNLPAALNRGDLSFVFETPRTHFAIGGGLGTVDYTGASALDENTWLLHADASRRFTPHLRGFLGYRVDQRDYKANGDIRTGVTTAGLDWAIGKSVFVTLGYSHTGSRGDSAQNQYSNNLLSLRLSLRGGAATVQPRTFGF